MVYQVSYQASLQWQISYTYGAGDVMQMSKFVSLQIMHYGKCFEVTI